MTVMQAPVKISILLSNPLVLVSGDGSYKYRPRKAQEGEGGEGAGAAVSPYERWFRALSPEEFGHFCDWILSNAQIPLARECMMARLLQDTLDKLQECGMHVTAEEGDGRRSRYVSCLAGWILSTKRDRPVALLDSSLALRSLFSNQLMAAISRKSFPFTV
jgi:hypothetical protein